MEITVNRLNVEQLAPLYHLCGYSDRPCPAYIELNPEYGTISADYSVESNSIPMDVYRNLRLQWDVTANASAAGLNKLMDEIRPLAERVCAGYSCVRGNGRYTDDAQEAIDAIERLCEDFCDDPDTDMVWDADDWLESQAVSAEATDEELHRMVAELNATAKEDRVRVIGRATFDVLEGKRQESRDELNG